MVTTRSLYEASGKYYGELKESVAKRPQKKKNGGLLKTHSVALRISKLRVSTQRLKLTSFEQSG